MGAGLWVARGWSRAISHAKPSSGAAGCRGLLGFASYTRKTKLTSLGRAANADFYILRALFVLAFNEGR
jgi:hypothetical protein